MMTAFKKVLFLFIISAFFACGESSSTSTDKTAKKVTTTDKKPSTSSTKKPETTKPVASKNYYVSAKYGFKIQQPDNWELLENQGQNVPVVFVNRPKGSFSKGAESITVAAENAEGSSLNNYYDFCKNQLISSGQTTGIIEESVGKSTNGYTFKRIIYNRKPNPNPVVAVSFLFVENNIGYVVTCSSANTKYTQMRAFFEEVGSSVEFGIK